MLRLKDLVVSSIVLCLLACSGGTEKTLLSRFFMAVRSGDNTTIVSMSLVTFPGEPGEVESWELIEVGAEASEPFRLSELRAKAVEARRERDIQFEKGKYFLEDNYGDIEKIQLKLDEDPSFKFDGKLGEAQKEWENIIQQRKTLERAAQEINREAQSEAKLAAMSVMRDIDVNNSEGNVLKKEVLVRVRTGTEEKPYSIALQRYDLTEPEGTRPVQSRWIIVAIQEQAT